jgi:prephenate dehydrogenase
MKYNKITIIGLGLIGGSLAKAFREHRICDTLIGVDRDGLSINLANEEGIIHRGYTELNQDILDSDIIFICTPSIVCKKIIEDLSIKIKEDCIITDVCSTKAEIMSTVSALKRKINFIGGHPMAGKEKIGYANGDKNLFQDALYIVTPQKEVKRMDVEKIIHIIKTIGGKPVIMDELEHDKLLAGVSHIPHLVAAALVNLLSNPKIKDERFDKLLGGGFIDTTRIASSSPIMWEEILLSNSKNIMEQLETFQNIIEELRTAIQNKDRGFINQYFENAKVCRDSFVTKKMEDKHKEILLDNFQINEQKGE